MAAPRFLAQPEQERPPSPGEQCSQLFSPYLIAFLVLQASRVIHLRMLLPIVVKEICRNYYPTAVVSQSFPV
jgi:hypothetical protein